jgi:excinuclease ABC subunit C
MARAGDEALVQVFFVRSGRVTGRERFMMSGADSANHADVLAQFITQYYGGTPFIPRELLTETEVSGEGVLSRWLSGLKGRKVTITAPRKGEKLKLVEMAGKNALLTLEQFGERLKREEARTLGALREITSALGLSGENIRRVEAYDISNTQGYESVASMVVFEDGLPKRSEYRKFRIKSVAGANDYASMEEVLTRRFARYVKETAAAADEGGAEGKFSKLPDLIFLDGGKGQVSSALRAMDGAGVSVRVCGMVKDDNHNTRGLIYNGEEIILPRSSEGFKLLTRIQDEVHRFAIEYHRKLREKRQIRSILDDIGGVGAARRKALMKSFGSIDAIRGASVDELKAVPSMNAPAAEAVRSFFAGDASREYGRDASKPWDSAPNPASLLEGKEANEL